MDKLLQVFELEKAVYELRYELNNRPDWVPIPVAGHRAHARRGGAGMTQSRASAFGELDIWLARAGRHEQLWEKLGAHVVEGGVRFAVWAPNARARERRRRLQRLGPAADPLAPGRRDRDLGGRRRRRRASGSATSTTSTAREKADPVAFRAEEPPPKTASVVFESAYEWRRRGWIEARRAPRAARRPAVDLRGARAVVAAAGSGGASSPTSSRRTCGTSASRTSSCCPSCTTRSRARGATR